MIITCEEDQFQHERHLRETFSKRTAHLGTVRTKLYENLTRTEQDAIQEIICTTYGERPLFAVFNSENSFVVITNLRLIWLTPESGLCALDWNSISSIKQGTEAERKIAKESELREKRDQQRLKWDSIEITDNFGQIYNVVFESGPVLAWTLWCLTALHHTYHSQQHGQRDPEPYFAHKYSSMHREQIIQSEHCGCFCCLYIFSPSEISHWIDRDATQRARTAVLTL